MLWVSATIMTVSAIVVAVLVARDPLLRGLRGGRWAVVALWVGIAPATLVAVQLDGAEAAEWPAVCLLISAIYLGICLFSGGRPAIVMDRFFDDGDSMDFTPDLRRKGVRAVLLTIGVVVVGIIIVVSLGPPDP